MKTYSRANKIPVIIVGILFLVSLLVVLVAFQIPTTKERTIVKTTYELKGEFTHSAFGQSLARNEDDVPKWSYFANLVETVDVSYHYQFVPAEPIGRDADEVEEDVEITAIIESPGLWEKEVVVVPKTTYQGEVDLTFPLNTVELLGLGAQISQELGVGNPSPHITLKAAVHLRVPTDSGVLEDDFTQTLRVSDLGSTLQWSGPLEASRKGFYKGLAYDHEGAFSYALYLRPSLTFGSIEKGEEGVYRIANLPSPAANEPIYFTNIIESMDVSYEYGFQAEVVAPEVDAEIIAVLENPGFWQKEVVLVPRKSYKDEFTIPIPLDVGALQVVAGAIAEQLGIGRAVPQITLKANVHVRAETPDGVQETDFTHTINLDVGNSTLRWDRELVGFDTGFWGDIGYEHYGRFDYAIQLKDNLLFGPVTLRPAGSSTEPDPRGSQSLPNQILISEPAPERSSLQLPRSDSYGSDVLERIDVTFSFPFEAEPRPRQVTQEVEITGELAGDGWKETLILVPKTSLTEEFTTTFALDVALVYAIISKEQQVLESSQDLVVTADVHTVADTEFGPIEEEQRYFLPIEFGAERVAFPENTPQVKEGNIHETVVGSNSSASGARTGSLGLAGMAAVALAFVGWAYVEARRIRLTELEVEALQVKSKYTEFLLDIQELPKVKNGMIVQINSPDELVKAAEALLKPILHVAEPFRHTYCVLDGTTQYQYTHEIEPPPPEPASPPKTSRLIGKLRLRSRHADRGNSSSAAVPRQAGNNGSAIPSEASRGVEQ